MAPCLPELPSLARLLVFTFRATGGLAMRKVIVGALAVVTMALLAAPVEAFGHRRRNCDSGCADVCAPAPQMAVTYQERVMTATAPSTRCGTLTSRSTGSSAGTWRRSTTTP